jgi:hypothetical protein
MTTKQFLAKLRNTPRRGWRLHGKAIRNRRHCPLSYVAHVSFCSTVSAVNELEMEYDDGKDIEEAADGFSYSEEGHKLRKQLLAACGLKERR